MQLLLERLADPGPGLTLFEAVQAQVQRLVGIHVWEGDAGLHLMGMASPPLADTHTNASLQQLAARLHALVAEHEPRLQVLRAEVLANGGPLARPQLVLYARLQGEDEASTLRFNLETS